MKYRHCRNCGTVDEPILVFCSDCARAWMLGIIEAAAGALVTWWLT